MEEFTKEQYRIKKNRLPVILPVVWGKRYVYLDLRILIAALEIS